MKLTACSTERCDSVLNRTGSPAAGPTTGRVSQVCGAVGDG